MTACKLVWALCILMLAQSGLAELQLGEVEKGACHKGRVRKATLKEIKQAPFSGLFRELRNSTVFEASGMLVMPSIAVSVRPVSPPKPSLRRPCSRDSRA